MGRPNIVVVMADDHAVHALSCYGSELNRTPNLDRIAGGGMRFDTCCCTNSICSPSRASILTGTWSHVHGVTTLDTPFDARQETFPRLLRGAGYQTALFGKWHLGHGGVSDPTGFDTWRVLPGQGEYWDPELLGPDGPRTVRGYVTEVLTDLALDWLEHRDPSLPFFLLLAHKAPHRPWQPDTRHADLYADADLPLPPSFDDDHRGQARAARTARMRIDTDLGLEDLKAPVPPGLDPEDAKRWKYQRYMQDYLRCVASIDDTTGRLLDRLDEDGLADDTLVVYTSDQGFFLGDHGWYDKRFMYEESLRMPLLVRWPAVVAPGGVNDDIVANVDLAPTFLEAAGVEVPARVQGRSLLPLLHGRTPPDWRTALYYRYWMHLDSSHRVEAHAGVRTRDRTLVHYYGDAELTPQWELFDLDADPYQLHSVHADPAYAHELTALRGQLMHLAAEVGDHLPGETP